MYPILICIFIICFIIGLPTILVGCNPNVENGCATREIWNGIVRDTNIKEKECSDCVSYCTNKNSRTCCVYKYYDCYQVNIKFSYSSSNKTCTYSRGPYEKSSTAEDVEDSYPIGKKHALSVDPNTNDCSTNVREFLNVWIVGVTFLSIAALMVLIGICKACFDYCSIKFANKVNSRELF